MRLIRNIVLLLAFCVSLFAQDCLIPFTIKAGATAFPSVDNTGPGCVTWYIHVFPSADAANWYVMLLGDGMPIIGPVTSQVSIGGTAVLNKTVSVYGVAAIGSVSGVAYGYRHGVADAAASKAVIPRFGMQITGSSCRTTSCTMQVSYSAIVGAANQTVPFPSTGRYWWDYIDILVAGTGVTVPSGPNSMNGTVVGPANAFRVRCLNANSPSSSFTNTYQVFQNDGATSAAVYTSGAWVGTPSNTQGAVTAPFPPVVNATAGVCLFQFTSGGWSLSSSVNVYLGAHVPGSGDDNNGGNYWQYVGSYTN